MTQTVTALVLAAACGYVVAPALGQALSATRVANGFTQPLAVTHAPGDAGRLFVVERTGRVRIINLANGTVNTTPFLNLSSLVTTSWLEYGLLGIAFHPDYQHNGYFYVNYTPSGATAADTLVVRYRVSQSDPNVADPSTATPILRFGFGTRVQHRAGWMDFGPDGFLYISTGDGAENDPDNAAQNLTLLRGKILRLDVNGPDGIPGTADDDGFPADANKNYRIPPGNPFAGSPTNAQEIWAFGLRNPWRCSFDRQTGDLWIGDVGQATREEVDIAPAGAAGGRNFGWRCTEGTSCTGLSGCTCNAVALTPPVYEYTHSVGLSVTGGYVYRGCALPEIRGTYIFADYQNSKFFSFRYNGTTVTSFADRTSEFSGLAQPSAFGEDAAGELYFCEYSAGTVQKIVARTPPPQSLSITLQPASDTACEGDAATFAIAATSIGSPATYQWQIQTAPDLWATLASDPLPLPCGGFARAASPAAAGTDIFVSPCAGQSAYSVRAVVSNACASLNSLPVTLTLLPAWSTECGGPGCDPDFNRDGNADQDDVAYLVGVIAGGPNPVGRDPDFNGDGSADQGDLAALINTVAGGECP